MASGNIKGITIEIGGNTTELQKALNKPEQDARKLQKELREINNSLKFNPDSLELLSQKSVVLGQQIATVSEKLKLLKESQAQVQAQVASGDIGEDQYRSFQRELEKTDSQLRGLKEQLVENGRQITSVGEKTGEAARNSDKYQQAIIAQKKAIEGAKESSKEHGKALTDVSQGYKGAEKAADGFSRQLDKKTIISADLVASAIKKAASALWDFANAGAESAREFETNQAKLSLVLKNTVSATDDYIASINALIEREEQLGVVSKSTQTAAAQELATYVTQQGILEQLIPVLNNMIAQQYGVNASQEAAVTVATALGKTLDGQVGSLQRWGYRFSEAEQAILKTNKEAQKASVIIRAVNDSVGGLNYGLRQTTKEGELFGKSLDLSNAQEKLGKDVERIKESLLSQLIPSLTEAIDVIDRGVVKNAATFENLGNIIATIINAFANLLKIIVAIPAPVLAIIAGVVLAVKTFESAEKGLKALNKVLDIAGLGFSKTTIQVLALVAAVSVLLFLILSLKDGTQNAERAIKSFGSTAGNLANQNVNAGQVRGYATGTKSAARGLAWVGEDGPELVNFHGGERVFNASQSRRIASSGSGAVNDTGNPQAYIYNDYRKQYVRGLQETKPVVDWYQSRDRLGWAK